MSVVETTVLLPEFSRTWHCGETTLSSLVTKAWNSGCQLAQGASVKSLRPGTKTGDLMWPLRYLTLVFGKCVNKLHFFFFFSEQL